MIVSEFCDLYIDGSEEVYIWDDSREDIVFSGTFEEAQLSEYSDSEVTSFGLEDGKIVINI